MIPCKHLDYDESKYPDCKIETHPAEPRLKYWVRPDHITENGKLPVNVQFCGAGRGRINQILPCYNGEMFCYEPESVEQ